MDALVYLEKGHPVTDSLMVAEAFGKRHADVLRSIDNLESSKEFNERNFALVKYKDAKKEERRKYVITRDGFTILAMGYTGKEAMLFKEKYIQEFNRMSEGIRVREQDGPLRLPEPSKQYLSGMPKYDLQQKWKWRPNPFYLSESLNFSTKRVLLQAIGDIGAIEHEQMVELFKVQPKHIYSMISGGEIIQHELGSGGNKYAIYTLGLRGSEYIGQTPPRVEHWAIPDIIEKLVFFEFVKHLQAGAAPYKFQIKADESPFVGRIAYPGQENKVYVLQRPINQFEVPEDDGTAIYVLAARDEYAEALNGEYGWIELFPYSAFMPVRTSHSLNALSFKRAVLHVDSDPFEFLNHLL